MGGITKSGSGSDREKVPRERRMRWPHFIQYSAESTLKGLFLAEKLHIRSGDASSVAFGDSFLSEGEPLTANHRYLKQRARLLIPRRSAKIRNSCQKYEKVCFAERQTFLHPD